MDQIVYGGYNKGMHDEMMPHSCCKKYWDHMVIASPATDHGGVSPIGPTEIME